MYGERNDCPDVLSFLQSIGHLEAQIKINKQQSRTLANLRDTLLPKLLGGQIALMASKFMALT